MIRRLCLFAFLMPCQLLLGCDGPLPPSNPQPLATEDFPSCVVKINGADPEGQVFTSGEELKIELELTLRDGLSKSEVYPPHVYLLQAADNEQGEIGVAYTLLAVEESEDEAENVFRVNTTWKAEAEPGTYEFRICGGLLPTAEENEAAQEGDIFPLTPVYRATVEVQ